MVHVVTRHEGINEGGVMDAVSGMLLRPVGPDEGMNAAAAGADAVRAVSMPDARTHGLNLRLQSRCQPPGPSRMTSRTISRKHSKMI